MRCPISLKSKTYREGRVVNVAGISGKVCAHYPGRSQDLFNAVELRSSRGGGKSLEKSAEGIVGVGNQGAEGLNLLLGVARRSSACFESKSRKRA